MIMDIIRVVYNLSFIFDTLLALMFFIHMVGASWGSGDILYLALTIIFCFTNRAYSDYIFTKVRGATFGDPTPKYSAEEFHEVSQTSVHYYRECFQTYSMRRCVYNNTLKRALQVSLFYLRGFPKL